MKKLAPGLCHVCHGLCHVSLSRESVPLIMVLSCSVLCCSVSCPCLFRVCLFPSHVPCPVCRAVLCRIRLLLLCITVCLLSVLLSCLLSSMRHSCCSYRKKISFSHTCLPLGVAEEAFDFAQWFQVFFFSNLCQAHLPSSNATLLQVKWGLEV